MQLPSRIAKRPYWSCGAYHSCAAKCFSVIVLPVMAPFLLSFRNGMAANVVHAPASLGRETRGIFRRQALEALDALEASGGAGPLVVDLAATRVVDSAGLGVLVLVQRRAAEVRRPVHLRSASEELRFLLVMTRLDDRFVFEGPDAT